MNTPSNSTSQQESNRYKKIVGYRNDLAKAITTKVTFKPVVETTDSKGRVSTNPIEHSQLKVLLDHAHYAEGGFPAQGSMFVAGEVPGQAEMVGNINGKTGVASGKEITGIADAVRDTGQTEAELLRISKGEPLIRYEGILHDRILARQRKGD